jgi:bifunctional non-homologous end joining protein LigD
MLVRRSHSRSGKDNEWFLFKERDEAAQPSEQTDIVRDAPLSVASGRDLDQIAAEQDQVWRSNRSTGRAPAKPKPRPRRKAAGKPVKVPAHLKGAKRAALPRRIDVKLATLVKDAPTGDDWLHEIKFDGYRMICRIDDGRVEFYSRNHKSWTKNLGHLADAASKLPVKQAILDGEVVAFKNNGVTDFQTLQNVFSETASLALLRRLRHLPVGLGQRLRRPFFWRQLGCVLRRRQSGR